MKGSNGMKWVWRVLITAIALALLGGIGFFLRPVSFFDTLMFLHEDFSGIASRSVRVEGIRVHYLVEGPANGPVVVLVHGLGGSAEDWRNLTPYLVSAGFRVYRPDLPGYGRSQRPRDFSYSVRDEAGVVVGFLNALGLKQVDLGGWSMGAWTVQLVAVRHPDRVRPLMLFDAAGLDVKPNWNTNLFMPRSAAELDELDALLMPHPPQIPAYVARDILRISRGHAWVIKRALDSMLTADDVTDKLLPELKMPVLIDWGEIDRITPVAQAETIHRLISQSQLDVYAGCGHLAPLECTAEMGPKVVGFLKQ
jgi:pimeloyl-ACP methyl ester carboxylesterase